MKPEQTTPAAGDVVGESSVQSVDARLPGLPELFDPSGPNAPMVFAVLAGRVPGRAFADDPRTPRAAVVQTRDGLAAFSRDAPQAFLDAALAALRADGMVGVVALDGDGAAPGEAPAKRMERLDFAPLDPSATELGARRRSLPEELRVAPLTAELLERCEWREVVASAFGGTDQFLEGGLGLCLVAGDEIVAEAYAPYLGRDSAEVGVFTPEAQRGRGYAATAAAFLAEALAERGLAMYWSCDADNVPSIRVAEKLGFRQPRPFAMLLYRPLAA